MITTEVVEAYSQCILKAYLILFTNKKQVENDYLTIIENKAIKNRDKYIRKLKLEIPEIKHFSIANMKNGFPALILVVQPVGRQP